MYNVYANIKLNCTAVTTRNAVSPKQLLVGQPPVCACGRILKKIKKKISTSRASHINMSNVLLSNSCNTLFDLIESVPHFNDHALDIISTISLYLCGRLSRLILNDFIGSRLHILHNRFNITHRCQENILIIYNRIDLMSLNRITDVSLLGRWWCTTHLCRCRNPTLSINR